MIVKGGIGRKARPDATPATPETGHHSPGAGQTWLVFGGKQRRLARRCTANYYVTRLVTTAIERWSTIVWLFSPAMYFFMVRSVVELREADGVLRAGTGRSFLPCFCGSDGPGPTFDLHDVPDLHDDDTSLCASLSGGSPPTNSHTKDARLRG